VLKLWNWERKAEQEEGRNRLRMKKRSQVKVFWNLKHYQKKMDGDVQPSPFQGRATSEGGSITEGVREGLGKTKEKALPMKTSLIRGKRRGDVRKRESSGAEGQHDMEGGI